MNIPTQQLLSKLTDHFMTVQLKNPITTRIPPIVFRDRWDFESSTHYQILNSIIPLPVFSSLDGFEYLSGYTIKPLHLYLFNWKNPVIETAIKEGYIGAFDIRIRDPKDIVEAINVNGINSKDIAKRYIKTKWWEILPYDTYFYEWVCSTLEPWLAIEADPVRKFDDDWREQYNDYWNAERAKGDPKKKKILNNLKDRSIVEIKNYKDSDKKELDEFGKRMANCLTTYFEKRHRVYEVTLEKGVTVAIDYDVKEDKFREVKLWNNLALPTNFKKWIKKEFRKWVGVETNP